MSSKNEFKAFSVDKNANVVDQERYEESHSLYVGFLPESIPSHLLNKALRQSSTISSVVADFIATQSGDDVLDDGNVAKLIVQLNKALEQKTMASIPDASLTQKGVVQLTNYLGDSDTLAVTQKLALEMQRLAVPIGRKVNGKSLITDINLNAEDVGTYYKSEIDVRIARNTATRSMNGWWQCGNTRITYQWGIVTRIANETNVYFPISFSEVCWNVQLTVSNINGQASGANILVKNLSTSGFTYYSEVGENSAYWFAIGY